MLEIAAQLGVASSVALSVVSVVSAIQAVVAVPVVPVVPVVATVLYMVLNTGTHLIYFKVVIKTKKSHYDFCTPPQIPVYPNGQTIPFKILFFHLPKSVW